MKFISWTNGWKTYTTVGIGIGVGVAQHFGYHIPSQVNWILGFFGLGFARMAITNQSKVTADALAILVSDILQQVTVPTTVTTVTTTTPPKSVTLATEDSVTTTAVSTGPVTSDDPFYNSGGAKKL